MSPIKPGSAGGIGRRGHRRLLQRQRVRTGFYTMLEDNFAVPFQTVVLEFDVTVAGVDLTEDDEITAVCTRGRSTQRIPILYLPLPTPPLDGSEWIEAYRRWVNTVSDDQPRGAGSVGGCWPRCWSRWGCRGSGAPTGVTVGPGRAGNTGQRRPHRAAVPTAARHRRHRWAGPQRGGRHGRVAGQRGRHPRAGASRSRTWWPSMAPGSAPGRTATGSVCTWRSG